MRPPENQPSLWFTPLPLDEILAEIQREYFPGLAQRVSVSFVSVGSLACIRYREDDEDHHAAIRFHDLLNHQDTPLLVFSHLFKHELLHLEIPARVHDGRKTNHPPEFWERERTISPEAAHAMLWIHVNFLACLETRPRLERIEVKPKWKKIWTKPRLTLEECRELVSSSKVSAPEDPDDDSQPPL